MGGAEDGLSCSGCIGSQAALLYGRFMRLARSYIGYAPTGRSCILAETNWCVGAELEPPGIGRPAAGGPQFGFRSIAEIAL